jgi:hypothetical protein
MAPNDVPGEVFFRTGFFGQGCLMCAGSPTVANVGRAPTVSDDGMVLNSRQNAFFCNRHVKEAHQLQEGLRRLPKAG